MERLSFAGLRRDRLDDRSWIDVVAGWVPDHADLFDDLLEQAPWKQRTRRMWDGVHIDRSRVSSMDQAMRKRAVLVQLNRASGRHQLPELSINWERSARRVACGGCPWSR